MYSRFSLLAIVLVLLATLFITGCMSNSLFAPKPYKETQFLMDTVIEITAYGPGAEEGIKEAFAEIHKLHIVTNNFDENSQVSKINQMAGKSKVVVNPDLIAIVMHSLDFSSKLEGAFDVTIGPLTEIWGIGNKGEYIPSQAEIEQSLSLVDYRLIEVDDIANTIYLPKAGMKLDLGGIAKGYAVDKVIAILKSKGITSALINAGGDVRVIGNKPDGKPWRIGVQHPRLTDEISAKLSLTQWDTMVTSGDYQRFIMKDGIRYSHIVDPRTGGQPREIASVTMVTNNSEEGDVLSTGIFVLGIEKGLEALKKFPDNEAIIITVDGKILITSGLEGKIELPSEVERK